MIVQKFTYDNEEILTIIHEAFDDYPSSRRLIDMKTIFGKDICFVEECVDDYKLPEYKVFKFMLENNHYMNPYKDYSVDLIEYRNYQKPRFINKPIVYEELIEISEFINKCSRINLVKYPYTFGNVLVFRPHKYKVIVNESKGSAEKRHIEVRGLQGYFMCVFEFKLYDLLVESIVSSDNSEITTDFLWDSFDVSVIKNEKIIFKSVNNRNIPKITFSSIGSTISKKIQLNTVEKSVEIKKWTYYDHNSLFKNPNEEYISKNLSLKYNLDKKSNNKVYFLGRNKTDKLFDILEDYSKRTYDELWIFDPYFLSISRSNEANILKYEKICDICILFSSNTNAKKKVIFNKSNEEKVNEFVNIIKDERLSKFKKLFFEYNFEMIKTSTKFHDRFIFLVKDDNVTGILFGGSFNQLGENYSTIVELDNISSAYILSILRNEVELNGTRIQL